ncbi:tyrosine-type recombinase/integrase [Desulfogranum japonicum]|uniref:tyrosine-type recombinase/integrase n=1 Tax=Desulfogranum japonicum TaxID=231447 RepID=UPI0038BDBDF3
MTTTLTQGGPYIDLKSTLLLAKKRAGITKRITPHVFCLAFGVHSAEKGIHLRSIQEMMGHSTSQVTEIYTRLATEHLLKEIDKF